MNLFGVCAANSDIRVLAFNIEDEYYLRNVGTYIIIQPTKDGKDILPFDYKWGSACLYFRRGPYVPPWYFDAKGNIMSPRPLSSYTYDRKRAILHSRHAAPDEWLVCNDILLPSNYIDVGRFESIYATCNRYRVFLSSSRQRMTLAVELRKKLGLSFKQLAALVRLPKSEIEKYVK